MILASSVFIILVTVAFLSWSSQRTDLEQLDVIERLQTRATIVSDLLTKQPSVFSGGNISQEVGLVSGPNVISLGKLETFSGFSYNYIKDALALGDIEISLKLQYANGTLIRQIGLQPSDVSAAYSTARILTTGKELSTIVVNGTSYDLCTTNVTGFHGYYYNLPDSHPDMETTITGVVKGLVAPDLPIRPGPNSSSYINQFDWYDETYFRFDRIDPNLNFGSNFFPVNNSLPGDPYYFAARWTGFVYPASTNNYTYTIRSDDDSWVFVDNALAVDNGGIHAAATLNGNLSLTAGLHKLDIFFAERHKTKSEFNFTIQGIPVEPFGVDCGLVNETVKMELIFWQGQ
jgi:fibro-slime domain-containing protein